MRKQILVTPRSDVSVASLEGIGGSWLDLQETASVQLSSEDAQYPFEHALDQHAENGWRASEPGPQAIKINFDQPQSIRRIQLQFKEEQKQRTQEFAVFVSSTGAQSRKEVVRQQWNFSAGGSAVEIEEYVVDLRGVTVFELEIDPGRHDRQAIASLQFIAIAG